MQSKMIPNDSAVNSLIIAIKSSSVEDIKKMIELYTPELVNKLELQTRQPSIFFSAVIIDEEKAYEIMKILLDAGANPHFKDQSLQSVLFYVCREGKTKCFEILLDAGMNINDPDIYGQTPLYYIARENRINLIEIMESRNIRIQWNQTDNIANQTPLFYAARQGNIEMCKLLIEKGTNVLHQDTTHKTAAVYAKKAQKNEVYEYLNAEIQKLKIKGDDRKQKKKVVQTKTPYKLVKSDQFGNVTEMTEADYNDFIKDYPDLKNMLENPDTIDQQKLEQAIIQQPWEKNALKIVNNCWKAKNASLFHEAVDPEKLGISGYFDIVKQPMDFTTIKKKLTYNVYPSTKQFVYDMNLVFSNCTAYNGIDNIYGKTALETKAYFQQQAKQVGIYIE